MAGDWMPIELETPDKPEVIDMALALEADQDLIVGKLVRLWSWANKNSADGNAIGVTETWIDRYVDLKGFAKAMAKVGWLVIKKPRGVTFPKFERHNGKGACARKMAANRVSEHRNRNGSTVTKPLPEKRREEKSNNGARANFGPSIEEADRIISKLPGLGIDTDARDANGNPIPLQQLEQTK